MLFGMNVRLGVAENEENFVSFSFSLLNHYVNSMELLNGLNKTLKRKKKKKTFCKRFFKNKFLPFLSQVPIVILKTKDMRNSTNIFLTNLSIADLLVLLVCTPTVLVEVNSKPETWVMGSMMCKSDFYYLFTFTKREIRVRMLRHI